MIVQSSRLRDIVVIYIHIIVLEARALGVKETQALKLRPSFSHGAPHFDAEIWSTAHSTRSSKTCNKHPTDPSPPGRLPPGIDFLTVSALSNY